MKTRKFKLARLLAAAAVLALMAASMTVGALAFGRETIVEVPAEQETIVMEDIGLTLILPDEWKDRYVVEYFDDDTCNVYVRSIYDTDVMELDGELVHGGLLFYLYQLDGVLTPQQAEDNIIPMPGQFVLATAEATYMLCYASDVQYDPADPAETEEYASMYRQISEIQVVVNDAFAQKAVDSSGR